MLRKLLKYETQSTARIFLPLYIVLFCFAFLSKIFIVIGDNFKVMRIPATLASSIYVMVLIAVFAINFVVMLQRFYKNLLSDEGYLSMTLPVKPALHILTKALSSMIWIAASTILALLSLTIVFYSPGLINSIGGFLEKLIGYINFNTTTIFIEFIIVIITTIISGTLMVYTSISIGHLINRHKIMASIIAYVAIYTIGQIIISIIIIISSYANVDMVYMFTNNIVPEAFPHIIMGVIIFVNLALSIVYGLITNHILTKKLNLD